MFSLQIIFSVLLIAFISACCVFVFLASFSDAVKLIFRVILLHAVLFTGGLLETMETIKNDHEAAADGSDKQGKGKPEIGYLSHEGFTSEIYKIEVSNRNLIQKILLINMFGEI